LQVLFEFVVVHPFPFGCRLAIDGRFVKPATLVSPETVLALKGDILLVEHLLRWYKNTLSSITENHLSGFH
jgi:hypothetical protein